jgi:hypothetical protein
MEFSADTLGMLRDEAYVFLCREVIEEKLDAIAQKKATIANTRPPFGLLARKSTRDAFTRSMSTALDNEAALQDRLVQIVRLEGWLQPQLHRDIAAYLAKASPDFQRFADIDELLDLWERGLRALPEVITAFTRDLRVVRETAAAGRRPDALTTTALVDIATRVEHHFVTLAHASLGIAEHARHVGADEIRLPTLPNLQRLAWVHRLGVMPLGQVAPEVARVESEMRALSMGGIETALARLNGTRELCTILQDNFLEAYWAQLRTHARIHYVEERDLDEVLATLSQQYDAAIRAQQRTQTSQNPFLTER